MTISISESHCQRRDGSLSLDVVVDESHNRIPRALTVVYSTADIRIAGLDSALPHPLLIVASA